jgi:uncharacterized membrane protein YjgN (DUF898 family)
MLNEYSGRRALAHRFTERHYDMQVACHYSILGLAVDATLEQIHAAYAGELARMRQALASGTPQPVERLDAVRQAYRVLSSPEQRQVYDSERRLGRVEPQLGSIQPAIHTAADITLETMALAPQDGGDTSSSSGTARPADIAAGAAARAAVSPAVAAASPGDDADEAAVEFRGNGSEYFRIWLVNVALTLLTLGIYSAWAKVRREKYFHRNLVVAGAAFDYHGRPRAILLGRAILLLLFMLGSLADHFGSAAKLTVSLLGAAAFPWLLVQSMRFRARNTSYRGLRFSFTGTYGQALVLYLVHGGLTVLSLGLYFPVFLQRQKAYLANHLHFGDRHGVFAAGIGAFYRGLALPLVLWGLAWVAGILLLTSVLAGRKTAAIIALMMVLGPGILLAVLYLNLILVPYARVVGTNLLWNHLSFGETAFRSTQRVRSYLGVVLSNWLLTLLTLGFFWPLAEIRLASYRARHLTVIAPAALADTFADPTAETPALGSETMDAIDLDIAL